MHTSRERIRSKSVFVSLMAMLSILPHVAAEELGIKVVEPFEVTEFANDELAHDIYSLTIDSLGRIVVSGPGYVRILVDEDKDGRADRAINFTEDMKAGAMGMYFLGTDLLYVADGGLYRLRDQNGDDRADGPPERFLKLKTGGEHDFHSIQPGPDGHWYLIGGNTSEITSAFATSPTSPVKNPRAGAILRLSRDLRGGEILADGLRNAYDFTFNEQGDLFTFDSDDERDISTPWYRPTRVYHVLPGCDHGWVSITWKRPDYYYDMPPVVGRFGRGSPTGLTTYRHSQFPAKYQGAVLALDWTYGRLIALPLQPDGSTWKSTPEVIATGSGQNGFAPTDLEVGPDGSLYVSVGGRGTKGSVYRIRAKSEATANDSGNWWKLVPRTDADKLAACLMAPQPMSSWSRVRWHPWAAQLGGRRFLQAARDRNLPVPLRVRALEIATDLNEKLTRSDLDALLKDPSELIRARAIWSHGRTCEGNPDFTTLAVALQDPHPLVVRRTLEIAATAIDGANWSEIAAVLLPAMNSNDRWVRWYASLVITRFDQAAMDLVAKNLSPRQPAALACYSAAWLARAPSTTARLQGPVPNAAMKILASKDASVAVKLDATRLLQWCLGDLREHGKSQPAFDSYRPSIKLADHDRDVDPWRIQLAAIYPTGHADLDRELGRVLAMIEVSNPKLLDQVLANINEDSEPVDDLHHLYVAASIAVPRTNTQQASIAKALLGIDRKIMARGLAQDSNWNDRFKDLYAKLGELDRQLGEAVSKLDDFGRPGHVVFLSQLPAEHLPAAIDKFVHRSREDTDYAWSNDVIFLLGESKNAAHREIVRSQFDVFAVRGAVLITLANQPEEKDRDKFLAGLDSPQDEVFSACIKSLEQLPATTDGREQMQLIRTGRRLNSNEKEFAYRERLFKILKRNNDQTLGFVFGPTGFRAQPTAIASWTEWGSKKWPELASQYLGGDEQDLNQLREMMKSIAWDSGDASRGAKLFQARSCNQCHGSKTALGPDLTGVAQRFSREDLFTAIVAPSRDVSARYQTTVLETLAGKTYTGLVVYESVDGLILRNSLSQTFRIETRDISHRGTSAVSLMPTGLLRNLTPTDYADLAAYLQTLGKAADTTSK